MPCTKKTSLTRVGFLVSSENFSLKPNSYIKLHKISTAGSAESSEILPMLVRGTGGRWGEANRSLKTLVETPPLVLTMAGVRRGAKSRESSSRHRLWHHSRPISIVLFLFISMTASIAQYFCVLHQILVKFSSLLLTTRRGRHTHRLSRTFYTKGLLTSCSSLFHMTYCRGMKFTPPSPIVKASKFLRPEYTCKFVGST